MGGPIGKEGGDFCIGKDLGFWVIGIGILGEIRRMVLLWNLEDFWNRKSGL